jgi:hypothetical protein
MTAETISVRGEPTSTGSALSADCDMCVDGVLINQTYGLVTFPPGTVPVQRCDNCAQYRSDEDAAVALAREWGSDWGVAGDPESDTEPGDWWVAFPAGRPAGLTADDGGEGA